MPKKSTCVFALLECIFLSHEVVGAPVLSFDEATGGSGLHSDISLGWRFNVSQSVTLEGLGWFDEHADGLQNAHTVGIWSPTGILLVSSTVPAGTLAPVDGQFRTAAVAPIVLLPGNGYIVGGQSFAADAERLACGNSDPGSVCFAQMTQTLDPRVQWTAATISNGAAFQRPSMVRVSSQGYYGPSFSVQAVPEPSTFVTLLFVFSFVCLRLRLNKFRSARWCDP
jgi:hypothetical protein